MRIIPIMRFRRFLKGFASALANRLAARLAHEWQALSRDEWRHVQVHFSQYGEDLIANDLLQSITRGVYVDVGAFDPIHFPNTLLGVWECVCAQKLSRNTCAK